MADPRNVAHDKKVMEEKKHEGETIGEGAAIVPQPGKKPPMEKDETENAEENKNSVNEVG
ncbi:MAG: hypothetical protein NVSMB56_13200 [Pyrinomonadaceae bacterium]